MNALYEEDCSQCRSVRSILILHVDHVHMSRLAQLLNVAGCGQMAGGSVLDREKNFLFHHVQNSCGTYPASNSVGTRGSFSWNVVDTA